MVHGNYPNPFNPVTTIRYSVPHSGVVTVQVYNAVGRLVATLEQGRVVAGRHEVRFNAEALASGLYVYTVRFDGQLQMGRMSLLK